MIAEPSISRTNPLDACSMEQEKGWQQPIVEYLIAGKVLKGEKEANIIRQMTNFYTIVAGELYR